MAFSPDGQTLAVAENGGVAALWQIATRTLIEPVLGATTAGPTSAVAFGPHAAVLATVSGNGVARLRDLMNFRNITSDTHVGSSQDQAFSRDGRTVATVATNRTVQAWNLRHRRRAGKPIPASACGGAITVAFSPDGKILDTGGLDGTARLWNLRTGRQEGTAIPVSTTAGVSAVAFSPDGKLLATGDDDGMVRIWDPRSGQ